MVEATLIMNPWFSHAGRISVPFISVNFLFSGLTPYTMNRDPMGESVGLNLYSYVSNEVMDLVDPYGLAAIIVCINKQDPQHSRLTVIGTPVGDVSFPAATGCCKRNPDTSTKPGVYYLGPWQPNYAGATGNKPQVYGPWFAGLYTSPLTPATGNGSGSYAGRGIHGHGSPNDPDKPLIDPNDQSPFGNCSHGCVRLSNQDDIKLHSLLPNSTNTPVIITDGC
jgi:hypothetical protein